MNSIKTLIKLFSIISILLLGSCELLEDYFKDQLPSAINLNKSSITLEIGQKEIVIATVEPENAIDKSVIWESSNTAIASVTSTGEIIGIAEGEAVISVKATAKKDITNSIQVIIKKPITNPESITIDTPITKLLIGETFQLQATVLPAESTDKSVSWVSSNPEIVSVSTEGLLTGKAIGKATITVMSVADESINNTLSINVETSGTTEIKPESITINNPVSSLSIGDTLQLQATVLPANATNKKVSWLSSNTNVATIDELGNLSVINLGETTISASISETNISNSFNLTAHHTIYSYSKEGEFNIFAKEYRPISDSEKNPTLPNVGDLTFVDITTESLAISENNPDIDSFYNPFIPFNHFIKLIMEKISTSNKDTINNIPFYFTISELPDNEYNKVIIKNNTIYGALNTKIDKNGYYAKFLLVMRVNSSNILETYIKYERIDSNFIESAYSIGELFMTTNIINNNSSFVSKNLELLDLNNLIYDESHSKAIIFTDDNNKISAHYIEEDKSQNFEVENSTGKADVMIYEVDSENTLETTIHTDFYNSNKELIALVSYNADSLDISKLDTNDLGTIVSNIDLQYSLKNILPLKPEYSNNYDLISIVTSNNTDISKRYYLFSKTLMGTPRQLIPSYNGGDVLQYINSFIDNTEDIYINTNIETTYDYPAYFTWTYDTSYFTGASLSTVATLRANFKNMYDKHWLEFRNSSVDYSKINRSQDELDIINSISK